MSQNRASRILTLSALAALLAAPLASDVATIESRKAAGPVKIDGQGDDWPEASLVLDARAGAEVRFQNDGRNLYIRLIVKNPKSLRSVESSGITVLAGPGGAKKTERGVYFVTRVVPAEDYIRWHESQGKVLPEGEKAGIRKAGRLPLFLAYAVGAKGSMYGPMARRQTDIDPPDFAVAWGEGEAAFELRIPLGPPESVPGGIGGEPGQTVRISFEWGGAQKSKLSAKATRETPPSEKGELSGSGGTWAQEYLDSFDSLSRPSLDTKKYAFAVDVKLAKTK